jgi:hypothetical protein
MTLRLLARLRQGGGGTLRSPKSHNIAVEMPWAVISSAIRLRE